MVFSGYLDFKYCDISSIDKCTARFKGNKLMPVDKLNQNSDIKKNSKRSTNLTSLYPFDQCSWNRNHAIVL